MCVGWTALKAAVCIAGDPQNESGFAAEEAAWEGQNKIERAEVWEVHVQMCHLPSGALAAAPREMGAGVRAVGCAVACICDARLERKGPGPAMVSRALLDRGLFGAIGADAPRISRREKRALICAMLGECRIARRASPARADRRRALAGAEFESWRAHWAFSRETIKCDGRRSSDVATIGPATSSRQLKDWGALAGGPATAGGVGERGEEFHPNLSRGREQPHLELLEGACDGRAAQVECAQGPVKLRASVARRAFVNALPRATRELLRPQAQGGRVNLESGNQWSDVRRAEVRVGIVHEAPRARPEGARQAPESPRAAMGCAGEAQLPRDGFVGEGPARGRRREVSRDIAAADERAADVIGSDEQGQLGREGELEETNRGEMLESINAASGRSEAADEAAERRGLSRNLTLLILFRQSWKTMAAHVKIAFQQSAGARRWRADLRLADVGARAPRQRGRAIAEVMIDIGLLQRKLDKCCLPSSMLVFSGDDPFLVCESDDSVAASGDENSACEADLVNEQARPAFRMHQIRYREQIDDGMPTRLVINDWATEKVARIIRGLTVRRARVEILRANEKMEEFGGALRWISACEHMSDRPAKLRDRGMEIGGQANELARLHQEIMDLVIELATKRHQAAALSERGDELEARTRRVKLMAETPSQCTQWTDLTPPRPPIGRGERAQGAGAGGRGAESRAASFCEEGLCRGAPPAQGVEVRSGKTGAPEEVAGRGRRRVAVSIPGRASETSEIVARRAPGAHDAARDMPATLIGALKRRAWTMGWRRWCRTAAVVAACAASGGSSGSVLVAAEAGPADAEDDRPQPVAPGDRPKALLACKHAIWRKWSQGWEEIQDLVNATIEATKANSTAEPTVNYTEATRLLAERQLAFCAHEITAADLEADKGSGLSDMATERLLGGPAFEVAMSDADRLAFDEAFAGEIAETEAPSIMGVQVHRVPWWLQILYMIGVVVLLSYVVMLAVGQLTQRDKVQEEAKRKKIAEKVSKGKAA
ncbi:unnamed protein product [Prorocentrum cordatum]|uniref:Uncharacterized protein n=1 Tax=Prorocentrum cordatum TaxID=2364126 RepID=A0ABN9UKC7_9DINO|nr:unnamed protein product [Polarella glacialis]